MGVTVQGCLYLGGIRICGGYPTPTRGSKSAGEFDIPGDPVPPGAQTEKPFNDLFGGLSFPSVRPGYTNRVQQGVAGVYLYPENAVVFREEAKKAIYAQLQQGHSQGKKYSAQTCEVTVHSYDYVPPNNIANGVFSVECKNK